MKFRLIGFLIWAFLFLNACSSSKKTAAVDLPELKKYKIFPYDLSGGMQFALKNELAEISGLSLSENKEQLVAVQDENGLLFFINKNNGTIEKTIDFKNDGDYEGVTYAYGKYFILKSSGTIYEMNLEGTEPTYKKHKHQLSEHTDHEGITYDPQTDKFIVICKDSKGLENVDDNTRLLYTVDVKNPTANSTPFLYIRREDVKTYLSENYTKEKIQDSFSKIFDEGLNYLHVGPSGIAIHPITGNIYVVCSKGKLLIVMGRDNKILKIVKLDKKRFPQPEGIVFEADGTMYIASEAKKNLATVSFFEVLD